MSDRLGRYWATRPIQTQVGRYDSANNDDVICFFNFLRIHGGRVLIDNSKIKLINKIVINQVITYWPSYGFKVCCIGPRPGQYSRPRTRNWANMKLLD